MKARTGFASRGVALIQSVLLILAPLSDAECLAVGLLARELQPPLGNSGLPRLAVHHDVAAVDDEVPVRCHRDVHPVHGTWCRAVEVRRVDEVSASMARTCPAVGDLLR